VIPRLASELKNELTELKGFSERNIGRMISFYRASRYAGEILPQPAAQLPRPAMSNRTQTRSREVEVLPQPAARIPAELLWSIPWYHHIIVMEKAKDQATRRWYMEHTLANGWSRNVLLLMVKSGAHLRQGPSAASRTIRDLSRSRASGRGFATCGSGSLSGRQ
jgi:hypothetical protein